MICRVVIDRQVIKTRGFVGGKICAVATNFRKIIQSKYEIRMGGAPYLYIYSNEPGDEASLELLMIEGKDGYRLLADLDHEAPSFFCSFDIPEKYLTPAYVEANKEKIESSVS